MSDVLWLLSAWLTADFFSGVVHWWEDRYGDPAWPVIGRFVIAPNIKHHEDQMAFTRPGYWQRNWTSIVPAFALAAVAYLLGDTFAAAVLLFLSQANEVHAWAHQRCSRPIRGLQMLGLLCSQEQHALHHRQPYSSHYCTLTDWVNPVLSRLEFWPLLESTVGCLTGVWPRIEREVA